MWVGGGERGTGGEGGFVGVSAVNTCANGGDGPDSGEEQQGNWKRRWRGGPTTPEITAAELRWEVGRCRVCVCVEGGAAAAFRMIRLAVKSF